MAFDVQRKPTPGAAGSAPAASHGAGAAQGPASLSLAYGGLPARTAQAAAAGAASPGEPLAPGTRAAMESSFGHDFSGVRVHRGEDAAASAGALSALAYTVGRDVVFGRGAYRPETPGGERLLAHELAHVVQQGRAGPGRTGVGPAGGALEREADEAAERATSPGRERARVAGGSPFAVQRDPITGTRGRISLYELGDSGTQVRTSRTFGLVDVPLSYDPATGVFTVTFPLVWIFAHHWQDPQRDTYVAEFVASVRRVWNDRFLLRETPAPRRTARVEIAFSNHVIHRMESAAHEQAALSDPALRRRWMMDVRDLGVRANVDRGVGVVHLAEDSNRQHTTRAADLRARAPFSISGTGGDRSFTQATSPHEFGHMIGLGDEYLNDSGTIPESAARGRITSRIMNVGEVVTRDAYAPFAEWISGLTGTAWTVGAPAPRP